MSFNIDVARAMVRGYNEEQGPDSSFRLVPPADDDELLEQWFDNGQEDDALSIMGVTPWHQYHPNHGTTERRRGQWDPDRARYLLMRGLGFKVTPEQVYALWGSFLECHQGYTALSYGVEKLATAFPAPHRSGEWSW